jgi:hypothetical protein
MEWLASTRDAADALTDVRSGFKRLLALLGCHLHELGVPLDDDIRQRLKAARVRETLRSDAARALGRDALQALASSEAHAVLLRGFLTAETVYPDPALRHCHDLDVLVPRERWPHAATVLGALGYRTLTESRTTMVFRHPSGFPISVHGRLFRLPQFEPEGFTFAEHVESREVLGVKTTVLTEFFHLLHVCGHAVTTGSRVSPTWAADIWFTAARGEGMGWTDPKWRALLDRAPIPLRAALSAVLTFVAESLECPVPEPFLVHPDRQPRRQERQVREASWSAALLCAEGDPGSLVRTSFRMRWVGAARYLIAPPFAILERGNAPNRSAISLWWSRLGAYLRKYGFIADFGVWRSWARRAAGSIARKL